MQPIILLISKVKCGQNSVWHRSDNLFGFPQSTLSHTGGNIPPLLVDQMNRMYHYAQELAS